MDLFSQNTQKSQLENTTATNIDGHFINYSRPDTDARKRRMQEHLRSKGINESDLVHCSPTLYSSLSAREIEEAKFDLAKMDLSQDALLKKIAQFLYNEAELSGDKNQKQIAKTFENAGGMCVGLSVLWSYGQWLESRGNPQSDKPKDDMKAFNNARQLLHIWDKTRSFTPDEKKTIEQFICKVKFFQEYSCTYFYQEENNSAQLDLYYQLKDTAERQVVKVADYNGVFTKNHLKEKLTEVIQPGRMIFICGVNKYKEYGEEQCAYHQMAAFQKDGDSGIYFYNPNDCDGETYVPSLDIFIDKIWIPAKPSQYMNGLVGWNPVEDTILKFGVEAFELYNKSEAIPQLPLPAYRLSLEEVSKIIAKTPSLLKYYKSSIVQSLLDYVPPCQLSKFKEILVEKEVEEGFLKYLDQHIIQAVNQSIKEFKTELQNIAFDERSSTLIKKTLIEQALPLKEYLSFGDCLILMLLDTDNMDLFKNLFDPFKSQEKEIEDGFGIYLVSLINESLSKGHIETLKQQLLYFKEIGIGPGRKEALIATENEELIEFIETHFGYYSCYQNIHTDFLCYIMRIKQENIKKEIKNLIAQTFTYLGSNNKQLHIKENILREALNLREYLSFGDCLILMLLDTDNMDLFKNLFDPFKSNELENGFGIYLVDLINESLSNGHIETLKEQLLYFKEIGIGPGRKETLIATENEEFIKFIDTHFGHYDCYHNIYKDFLESKPIKSH